MKPFLLIGTAGTTNAGAIDDLDKLSDICQKHDIWFHIDAAFGGPFVLADSVRSKFKGIERANSLAIDPHKMLFLPFGNGVALIPNGRQLYNSFNGSGADL